MSHVINLSVSPPSCSIGCLRLLGAPCNEMCLFATSLGKNIEDLLPKKLLLQSHQKRLTISLPDNHPNLIIDKDSMTARTHPVILPPFIRRGAGRPASRRLKKCETRKVHMFVANVVMLVTK